MFCTTKQCRLCVDIAKYGKCVVNMLTVAVKENYGKCF